MIYSKIIDAIHFRWFFGKISRTEAERRLLNVVHDRGTYIVRESEKEPGKLQFPVKKFVEILHRPGMCSF